MKWKYRGKYIDDVSQMPNDVWGFVYMITADNGKKYIGKKTLYSVRKRKFGKKEAAKVTDKRKKLYEIVKKESDWKKYTGSNKELNEDIESGIGYTKEILHFAYHKKQLSYLETKELFVREVLESHTNYYNSNISGTFYKKDTL